MRRHLGIGVAWLGATALSVLIASAAVAGIRDGVVDAPAALGAPTTTTTSAPAQTTTPLVDPVTSTTAASTTTATPDVTATTEAETTTTTAAGSTTTTEPPQATTTTTTTTSTEPPQTTTTAPPAVTYETHPLVGGTVTLAVGNGEVSVASANANIGFTVDIEKNGPHEVEVKFVSDSHKSELSAKFENGQLKVEKEEEPRDGDED